jgi:hypothetical protein
MSEMVFLHWVAIGACETHLPAESCYKLSFKYLFRVAMRPSLPSGRIFEAKFCLGRGRSRDPPGPEKPRFWACQKVVPPPCKNVQKMGFLGEKACIFGQFVHNFAQKWPLFCGHSPPLQGCQSVGKKPANLYSTKCRIFGPRTPPPVAPWWDTSSRRPPTGSRHPFLQNR